MTCPVCGEKSLVKDSRGDCEVTYRKRVCVECEHIFYTVEREERDTKWDYRECVAEYTRTMKLKRIARNAK
jgi:transcriptional regulator NrdR family protein